ncbi:MAG: 1-deoxy-D-xylulose-5-phosphate synthase, partial [Halanaerobiales bacterium]
GLSGYPKKSESEHDIIETGHTATSISSALGLASARDLEKEDHRIYAVIGDGAMTGGMAFEALNHAGHLGKNIKVILNDNEMSIASNVGALPHYLTQLRTDPTVNRLKEDLEFLLNKIPKIGSRVSKTVERVKNSLKYLVISGVLFEEMGFTYMGPIDGHNIKELKDNFIQADRIDGPVIIHVHTIKGKGYKPAEETPSQFHGVSPFEIKSGKPKKEKNNPTYSQIFGKTMVKMGKEDEDIVGITAAMPHGTGLINFVDEFPERSFDVGIAEQHAVTYGAGLARGGKKPVIAIYSTFLQRAYDQVIHDVCIQDLPVTLAIDRAGIVGSDGETHQGLFDFSYLRPIPNMVIMAPRDENQLQHMLYTAVNHEHPAAVRYPRGESVGVEIDDKLQKLPIGKGEVLREGDKLLITAIGNMVYPALEAAEELSENGIEVGVIDARFVKPLPEQLFEEEFKKYDMLLTVEEQALMGGFGSAVMEFLNKQNINIELNRLGVPDQFVPHGSADKMRSQYGLDARGIKERVLKLLEQDGET